VLSAVRAAQAEELFREHEVSLIISDITMEDGDGLAFCRSIRRFSDVHLIFLTALDQEVDIVNGYDAGADDYITKPFSLMVLISKVNALMRRIGQDQDDRGQTLFSRDIRAQCREMRVYKGEEELILSKKEMQLLLYFLEYPKQIISKEQILEAVWDTDGQFVDEGIGIEKSEYQNIFKRFYRGKRPEVEVQEGAGVGLYLVRKIFEEQGGNVCAVPAHGRGTVIRMMLPKKYAAGRV